MRTNFKIKITSDEPFNLPLIHMMVHRSGRIFFMDFLYQSKMRETTDPLIPEEITEENVHGFTTTSYTLIRTFDKEEDLMEYLTNIDIVKAHEDLKKEVLDRGLQYEQIVD